MKNLLLAAATIVILGGILLAIEHPRLSWALPRNTPPVPTTCYLRASGDNAVLEVTGVDAARGCRDFQEWSLKNASTRVLEWSEARPDPSTLKMPLFPTSEEQASHAPTVKTTCTYTLGAFTYTVTDTGGMTIGQGWCREFYSRAVKAG